MDNITRKEIRKLCRVCLKIQPHMRFLSSSELIDGKFCTLSQMLKSCSCIQVTSDNEFPNMICQSCINRLFTCWEFKTDCENSEAKLQEILNSNKNMKEMEENMNLTVSNSDVTDNITSINMEQDIQVLKVISVKKINKLKIVKGNIRDDMKEMLVKNLNEFVKLHNNNNNNLRVENENLQLENSKKKLIILEKPLICDEIPKNNVQYLEEIEYNNNNNIEQLSASNSLNKSETIDLTLTDSDKEESAPEEKSKTIKTKKVKDAVNQCVHCLRKFETKIGLHLHVKTHTDVETHCCPVCEKTFSLSSNLEMHLKTHAGINSLKCPKCTKYFLSAVLLNQHKRLHDDKLISCELCCKKFSTQIGLKRHLNLTHSGINQFFCDVCMKGFTLKIMLKHHRKIHVEDNSYKCEVCEESFLTCDELSEHGLAHAPVLSFECDKCCDRFATDYTLKQHLMQFHGIEFILCTLCSTEFDTKTALKQHVQEHKKIQSLTCKVCEKVCASTVEVKGHVKTHFSCEECPESFENLRLLSVHRKKHFVSGSMTN